MFTSVNTRSASVYKRVAVETGVQAADSHRLVGMLFDGLLQAVATARGAMERGDLVVKGEQIGKAVRKADAGPFVSNEDATRYLDELARGEAPKPPRTFRTR